VVANNLANINTTAFRRDLEVSMALGLRGEGHDSRAYSALAGNGFDPSTGTLVQTGNSLDVAIQGEGWFAVQGPDGQAYTRSGDWQVDGNGTLVTGAGMPVLGEDGPITVPPFEQIEFGADGTVSIKPMGALGADLVIIDRLLLSNPPAQDLVKAADGLLYLRAGAPAPQPDAGIRVVSGVLETSNVSGVEQMVRQIELARRFDLQVSMMSEAKDLESATDAMLRAR
jgi:flagellar basal-body rod protein FlgF